MEIKKGPIAERIATGPSWGYLFHSGQLQTEFNHSSIRSIQINPDQSRSIQILISSIFRTLSFPLPPHIYTNLFTVRMHESTSITIRMRIGSAEIGF